MNFCVVGDHQFVVFFLAVVDGDMLFISNRAASLMSTAPDMFVYVPVRRAVVIIVHVVGPSTHLFVCPVVVA